MQIHLRLHLDPRICGAWALIVWDRTSLAFVLCLRIKTNVGQDIFGFCALPSHKNRANFWTSEESSSREAENAFVSEHSVGHNWKYADPYVLEKVDCLAIRCVKD